MAKQHPPTVQMIPVSEIQVANPRARSKRIFGEVVASISQVGLKRPITVARRAAGSGYDLVCGQGRLEAYMALGQQDIPAIIIEADEQDRMVMSLVENLARRQHSPIELLHDIGRLRKRGYNANDIARKTGLTSEYVRGISRLLDKGEIRLLSAVETGRIPLNVAIEIATTDGEGVQAVLQKAYEEHRLKGKGLLLAKRLVEQRRHRGKAHGPNKVGKRPPTPWTTESLMREYRQEVDRQRVLVKKAELTQYRLMFVVQALSTLIKDENFTTLLRAEALSRMPRYLAERMTAEGART